MHDDLPRIAILGAGPIGLEAALYARYLGYRVVVIEKGDVADNVRQWGHLRMFSPFGMNRSTLALAALAAQDPSFQPPADGTHLTGAEWAERYLIPLSQTDLVMDCIQTSSRVISVSRGERPEMQVDDGEQPATPPFKLLIEARDGGQPEVDADVVIDATGVFNQPRYLGEAGSPASGEIDCQSHLHYHVPDLLGVSRQQFGGRRVLVVGNGYSAATAVALLAELKVAEPVTTVVWATPRDSESGQPGLAPQTFDDPLPERAAIVNRANQLVMQGVVQHAPNVCVEMLRLEPNSGGLQVSFAEGKGVSEFDRIIVAVGHCADVALHQSLHVTEIPVANRTAWAEAGPTVKVDPEMLRSQEPNYYVLGAKSFGSAPGFSVSIGLQQIRSLFTLIGERDDLDLYATH